MASRYHGVSPDTYKRMVLNAGEVRVNFTDLDDKGTRLGATKGGSVWAVEPEMREVEVDGAPGPVMGAQVMDRSTARLECNFVEINEDILQMAMPGSSIEDVNEDDLKQLKRSMRLWSDSYTENYKDNIVLFAEVAGTNKPVICGIKNALATGAFELSLEDKSEAVLKVEFHAHFDPVKLEAGDLEEPWILYYPETFVVEESTTTTTA